MILLNAFKNLWKDNWKKKLFYHISTDEVYGSLGETGLFEETTPYNPNSPYSASKASSDHFVRAWHTTYDLPVTISNCSNNYGIYQFPEKLIPLMIINGILWKPLPIYGKGENIRDWLFVDDHARAIWSIIDQGTTGETYNVGGGAEMSNLTVVNMICDILDGLLPDLKNRSRNELITFVKDRPGHDFRYAIDSTKICNQTDWLPQESFETGLRQTVRWFIENKKWWQLVQEGTYDGGRLGLNTKIN
jgi:dTDP-glucose 4,6-dehydratase